MELASIFETLMILSFGVSWPMSIIRSYRSRSTKGKSIFFSCFIAFGYVCGIIAKIMTHHGDDGHLPLFPQPGH